MFKLLKENTGNTEISEKEKDCPSEVFKKEGFGLRKKAPLS